MARSLFARGNNPYTRKLKFRNTREPATRSGTSLRPRQRGCARTRISAILPTGEQLGPVGQHSEA
eukprot:6214638-Pleurochrysis_carterae.AAC.1